MKGGHHLGFKLLLGCTTLVVFLTTAAWAGSTFRFSERLSDQLLCSNDDNEVVISCQPFQSGRFRLEVAVPESEINASQFGPTTPIHIVIGDFTFTGTLGDDPRYTAGKSMARIRLTDQVCDGLGCTTFTHGVVVLQITKAGLKITISTRTGADVRAEPSALAINYINDTPGMISDFLPSSASIEVGDISASTNLAVSATVQQRMTSALGEEFTLGNVKLSAFAE